MSHLILGCQSSTHQLTPSGKLATEHGHSLHVQEMGSSSKVTVIFESGMSGKSISKRIATL